MTQTFDYSLIHCTHYFSLIEMETSPEGSDSSRISLQLDLLDKMLDEGYLASVIEIKHSHNLLQNANAIRQNLEQLS